MVLVVLLALSAYKYFQKTPQVEKTSNSPDTGVKQEPKKVDTAMTVPPGAVKYAVDPTASTLEWSSEKKLIDWKHNGTVAVKTGELYAIKDEAKGDKIMGHIVIDMNSLTNLDGGANEKLIGHLKSADFFDVATYPEAMIDFTAAIDPAMTVEAGTGTPYKATGTMTIRGKSNPVEFGFNALDGATTISATTELVIDRSKYGIAFGSETIAGAVGDKIIKDEIPLRVTIVAKKG